MGVAAPADAARMATAMLRSKPLPRLGRLAGDRPMVILLSGHFRSLLRIAARMRSRASRRAVSGSPTMITAAKQFLPGGDLQPRLLCGASMARLALLLQDRPDIAMIFDMDDAFHIAQAGGIVGVPFLA